MKGRIGKQNIHILLFAILLTIAAIAVAVSFTWSRYQTSTVVEIPFEVKEPGTFHIIGLETDDENGEVTETDSLSWKALSDSGNYQMDFRITNDKDNSEDNETEYYKLRVATTLGVTPVEESEDTSIGISTEETSEESEEEQYQGLVLVVTTPNGIERTYKGIAEEFTENSVYYEEIGPGYLYSFFDMDGNELIWKLEGGTYSTQDHRLQLRNISEPSLMEVIVVEASGEQ